MKYLYWEPRWYYILKNVTSGKLYFGQRKHDDIGTKYLGSGPYWKNHCKKYGGYSSSNIEVLWKEYYTNEEDAISMINQFEIIEGDYWLVENKKWANQCPENTLNNPFYGPYINEKNKEQNSRLVRERERKKVELGTHMFLGGDIQRKHGTRINQERVESGTHNFLTENGGSDRARKNAKKRIKEGTHHFQNTEFKEKVHKVNKKRLKTGEHNFLSNHPNKQKYVCKITGIISTKSGFTQRAKNKGLECWPYEIQKVEQD